MPPLQETPVRVPDHPARSLARCTPTVPTAPTRPWSACGAAAPSVVLTPLLMSSLSLMASVWSGRQEIVLVSVLIIIIVISIISIIILSSLEELSFQNTVVVFLYIYKY